MTTKEYKDYIIEQLNLLNNITYKPMMGEYLLYYNGTLFGGIYDDRLLVKSISIFAPVNSWILLVIYTPYFKSL